MNPSQGHGGQGVLPQGHFDILMSAIAASGQQLQQQQQQQYVPSGQNQVSGMNTPMSSLMQNTPSGPPTDTAMSLDQMFGHSGFSSAISLAQATPPNQLNTPFYEILLQNLLQQQQHQNHSQPDLAPAHIQQTRSGRISRPPVPYQMAQTELMRALQMLSQPGMEPVRAAMESAGLFQGMGQAQGDMGEAEKRDQAISQAMQLYAAAQNRAGESTQGYTGATGVASTNGYAHSATRNQNGSDSLPKGTKRPRKSEPTSSSRPPNTRHTQPAPYSPDNWPAPPRGKGSRLAMSKEEIASRRKERNKASALASRMKRANEVEDVKDALARKEAEAEELARKCECLERELETIRQLILSHGLSLPTPAPYSQKPTPTADIHVDSALREVHPTEPKVSLTVNLQPPNKTINGNAVSSAAAPADPTQITNPVPFNFPFPTSFPTPQPGFSSSTSATLAPDVNTQTDPAQTQFTFNPFPDPFLFQGSGNTMDTGAEPILDFNMFMNMDNMLDDEADGDFQPETSPHQGSDTDADGDGDGDEGEGDGSTPKAKRLKNDLVVDPDLEAETPVYGEEGEGEMGDEDFIDPEMEDEDLFLPIEDVPIPPDTFQSNTTGHDSNGDVTGAMMKALKVDTRDQLAAVMQKLVDSAGEGGVGVGEEILGKLRNVIMMAQNQAGQG